LPFPSAEAEEKGADKNSRSTAAIPQATLFVSERILFEGFRRSRGSGGLESLQEGFFRTVGKLQPGLGFLARRVRRSIAGIFCFYAVYASFLLPLN